MIRLDNVTKYFVTTSGRHYVLNNVSLTIPDGCRIGVVGPNGVGKSTLMRLLAAVDVPNSGTITRTGSISWPMGLATGLQGSMTGRENARFGCRIQGLNKAEIREQVKFIEGFCDIGKYFNNPVRTYSAGMRARLNFAIAMAFDFDCYIIDELTAVGDRDFKEKSQRIFKEKRHGASFIKVSHNLQELKQECDCGLLLFNGKARYFPTFEQTYEAYERLLGGNSKPVTPPPKPAKKPAPLDILPWPVSAPPKPAKKLEPVDTLSWPVNAPTKPVKKPDPVDIIPWNAFKS